MIDRAIRTAAAACILLLAACSTTSTIHQPLSPSAVSPHTYTVAFENRGGDDLEGITQLERVIVKRLNAAGLLANGASTDARIEVTLTHFYVRSNASRFLAGILAGRDKIVSQVRVLDSADNQMGNFEVETTNVSAWGSTEGLMEKHADEIVERLKR